MQPVWPVGPDYWLRPSQVVGNQEGDALRSDGGVRESRTLSKVQVQGCPTTPVRGVAQAAQRRACLPDASAHVGAVLRCCLDGDGRRSGALFGAQSGMLNRRVEEGRRRTPLR